MLIEGKENNIFYKRKGHGKLSSSELCRTLIFGEDTSYPPLKTFLKVDNFVLPVVHTLLHLLEMQSVVDEYCPFRLALKNFQSLAINHKPILYTQRAEWNIDLVASMR